jgi:copper oxidase (laccase) domain-containing protein
MFDLPGYVAWRLERVNVAVTRMDADTYAAEGDYFSYRRATHKGEQDYGRQISAIVIAP